MANPAAENRYRTRFLNAGETGKSSRSRSLPAQRVWTRRKTGLSKQSQLQGGSQITRIEDLPQTIPCHQCDPWFPSSAVVSFSRRQQIGPTALLLSKIGFVVGKASLKKTGCADDKGNAAWIRIPIKGYPTSDGPVQDPTSPKFTQVPTVCGPFYFSPLTTSTILMR